MKRWLWFALIVSILMTAICFCAVRARPDDFNLGCLMLNFMGIGFNIGGLCYAR